MGADHDEWRAHESSEEPSGQGRFSQGSQMCDTFNYSDAGRLADRQSQPAPGSSGTHSQQINEYYEESRFYQQPVGHHHNHLNPLPNTWSHSNYPSQGIAQNSWTGSYDWNAGQAAYYDQSGENSGSDINSAACSQSSCDSGYFSSPRKAVVDDQWNNVAAVGQQTSRSHIGTVEVKEEISFENSHQANHQSDEYQCGSTVPTEIGNTLTNKGIDPQGRTIRWGTIIPLIGGSSLGCQLATGTKPLYHLSFTDFSKNESHLRRYWPDIPYFDLSVNPTIPQDYTRDIDFITTVCPCAGLSMLNTSKGDKMRGSEAVQNIWMIRSAEFVLSVIKPKCFWGENAPGLFTKVGEDVLLMLRNIGAKYNYTLTAVKTNTLLHGIPQSRVRTFYFFWKSPTVPLLGWKLKPRKNLVEYLAEIPAEATHQDWHMTDGKATDRFKPYLFVLQKERLSHKDFSVKFGKGTITEYLFKHNLIDECLAWLKAYHPTEGFYNKGNGCRTFIQYLEHARMKVDQGKGYWDDSPRFVGMDSWPAMIRKSMITAVHPVEDRYLNVREMMHLMGLPMDFQIDHVRNINHIAQNVPVCTAKDYADEVVKFCLGQAQMTDFTFLKQDNIKKEVSEQTSSLPEKGHGPESPEKILQLQCEKSNKKKREKLKVPNVTPQKKSRTEYTTQWHYGRNNPVYNTGITDHHFGGNQYPSHSSWPTSNGQHCYPTVSNQPNGWGNYYPAANTWYTPQYPPPTDYCNPGVQYNCHTRNNPQDFPAYKEENVLPEDKFKNEGNAFSTVQEQGELQSKSFKLEEIKQEEDIKEGIKAESLSTMDEYCKGEIKPFRTEETNAEEANVSKMLKNENIEGSMAVSDGIVDKPLSCYKCGQALLKTDKTCVYKHYSTHYQSEILDANKSTTECGLCGQKYSKPKRLAVHIGSFHNFIENYIPDSAKVDAGIEFSIHEEKSLKKVEDVNSTTSVAKNNACNTAVDGNQKPEESSSESNEERNVPDMNSENLKEDDSLTRENAISPHKRSCYLCRRPIVYRDCQELYAHYLTHLKKKISELNISPRRCTFCRIEFDKKSKLTHHVAFDHNKLDLYIPKHAKYVKCTEDQYLMKDKKTVYSDQSEFSENQEVINNNTPKKKLHHKNMHNTKGREFETIKCFKCSEDVVYRKAPLYVHYSKHFIKELMALNGKSSNLECYFCKISIAHGKMGVHIGLKHNKIENFIPASARYTTSRSKLNKTNAETEEDSFDKPSQCLELHTEKSISIPDNPTIKCFICSDKVVFVKKDLYEHYTIHLKKQLKRMNPHPIHCFLCEQTVKVKEMANHIGVCHNKVEELIPNHASYDNLKLSFEKNLSDQPCEDDHVNVGRKKNSSKRTAVLTFTTKPTSNSSLNDPCDTLAHGAGPTLSTVVALQNENIGKETVPKSVSKELPKISTIELVKISGRRKRYKKCRQTESKKVQCRSNLEEENKDSERADKSCDSSREELGGEFGQILELVPPKINEAMKSSEKALSSCANKNIIRESATSEMMNEAKSILSLDTECLISPSLSIVVNDKAISDDFNTLPSSIGIPLAHSSPKCSRESSPHRHTDNLDDFHRMDLSCDQSCDLLEDFSDSSFNESNSQIPKDECFDTDQEDCRQNQSAGILKSPCVYIRKLRMKHHGPQVVQQN